MIEWKDSYKYKIASPVLTTANNVFAILSVSDDPTTKQVAPVLVPSPISCKTDSKTIMFDPKEHRRQCKIAWQKIYNRCYDNWARVTTCSSRTASL